MFHCHYAGTLFARYEYDAWGKLLSIKNANGVDITNTGNFAIVNPFRYRGYYYDTESGLYYLQSRYYDPTTGRFVNADVIAYSTNDSFAGMNLYAYAKNNYISCIDSNGYFVITLFTLATVAVATVATVATATVVITVVNSPSFQRDLNNLINQIRTRISSLLRPVSISKGKSISKTWFGHIPLYYGADIRGGTWKKVTGAMTLSQAVAWVKTTASKKVYEKNASWGVYTRSQSDAFALGLSLGQIDPIPDKVPGCFPHYHMKGHILFGLYKHFHLWYGLII